MVDYEDGTAQALLAIAITASTLMVAILSIAAIVVVSYAIKEFRRVS